MEQTGDFDDTAPDTVSGTSSVLCQSAPTRQAALACYQYTQT
jgi:hypothetical protein